MTYQLKLTMLAGASALALAACSDGDDGNITPPPGQMSLEENFGPAFATLFRANANSDPADPTATSVIAVSLTTDPVPVP